MTEEQYLWMIGQKIDSGEIKNWESVLSIVNKELLGDDETIYRTESAWRKKYQAARKFYDSCFSKMESDDYYLELQELKDTIYKEKRKLYDQRREYNKLLTYDARAEHLYDELLNVVNGMNKSLPLITEYNDNSSSFSEREGICCFTDWHYGMVTDNIWNKFNTEICKERVSKTVSYMNKYIVENGIRKIHVLLLGDFAHGCCHVTCRVKSEEDVCDQLMHSAEIIAEAINELSRFVDVVEVHSCYGNHMRTIQKKDDSIDSDNMEKIVPWWLKCRLENNKKVTIFTSDYKEFTLLNVMGYNICCVHGNGKKFSDIGILANTIFTKKFNTTIDYTISGDKHHLEEFEQFDIESILVRCLCGSDDYASERNLYSKPGQTFIVFNKEGRECTYHINLK